MCFGEHFWSWAERLGLLMTQPADPASPLGQTCKFKEVVGWKSISEKQLENPDFHFCWFKLLWNFFLGSLDNCQPIHARLAKQELYGVRAAGNYGYCFQVYCLHRVLPLAFFFNELTVHFGHHNSPSIRILVWVKRGGNKAKAFDEEHLQNNLKLCIALSWAGIRVGPWATDNSKKIYLIFLSTWTTMLPRELLVSSVTGSRVVKWFWSQFCSPCGHVMWWAHCSAMSGPSGVAEIYPSKRRMAISPWTLHRHRNEAFSSHFLKLFTKTNSH